jgi:hypothetical protein
MGFTKNNFKKNFKKKFTCFTPLLIIMISGGEQVNFFQKYIYILKEGTLEHLSTTTAQLGFFSKNSVF